MHESRYPFLILCIIFLSSICYADPPQEAINLQDAFVKVSQDVGPAVVSISTEHTERYRTMYNPFSRFKDDFFSEFFDDFFVTGPEREFKRVGLGSGVIIDKKGYILTNEHVVGGADRITVTLPDGREFDGRMTGADVFSDLAVIKIEPKGELPFARLGNSNEVKIGQWAIAIGNPFGFAVKNPEPTMTVGVVSALNRSLPRTDKRAREYSDLIQTDAAINPGNSGGPLLNIYGEVIGINVAIFTMSGGSEGVGFAIPVNTAKKIMGDLIEGREVLYGWIGVIIQDIDSNLARHFSLDNTQGVLLSRIISGSPAEKAGLQSGDVIVSFDGSLVRNTQDLIRMVLKKDIGEKVNIGIVRNGKKYYVTVEIDIRPGEGRVVPSSRKSDSVEDRKDTGHWRGIDVSDISQDIVKQYNLSADSGVIVTKVEPMSAGDEAGIRVGDVIFEMNRQAVKDMRDYRDAIRQASGDMLIGTYRGYVVVKDR